MCMKVHMHIWTNVDLPNHGDKAVSLGADGESKMVKMCPRMDEQIE